MYKNGYRKLKYKEYNAIKRNINNIYLAASFYKSEFVNKKLTFYTQNESITIVASVTNFMHLCGVYYLRGKRNFFQDACDKKLDLTKILIKNDGTTFQKLQVLGSFPELLSHKIRLTNRGRFLRLDFDYALRTSKQILALTLIDRGGNTKPQSILNLHKMKRFDKGEPVIKIESQEFNSNKKIILFPSR